MLRVRRSRLPPQNGHRRRRINRAEPALKPALGLSSVLSLPNASVHKGAEPAPGHSLLNTPFHKLKYHLKGRIRVLGEKRAEQNPTWEGEGRISPDSHARCTRVKGSLPRVRLALRDTLPVNSETPAASFRTSLVRAAHCPRLRYLPRHQRNHGKQQDRSHCCRAVKPPSFPLRLSPWGN